MKKSTGLFWGLSLLLFLSCNRNSPYHEESGAVFNTIYHIRYQAPKLLTEQIDAGLDSVGMSLNPFNPNSIIAKINKNEAVEVDAHFRTVFNKAMEISRRSNGFFDITSAPLLNAWGFGAAKIDSVTPQMIDSFRLFVGYEKVRLEGNRIVKKDPRVQLNCSAIAKGYACDVVAAMLERHGVENYMVEIGGEVTVKGVNEIGRGWSIGIRKPEKVPTNTAVTVNEIVRLNKKGGIATSGDYQNFYMKDGKRFAHTINPLTGYPAEQNILSCTIVAEDCMTADGYATALMALGMEEAVRIAGTLNEIDYYLIYVDKDGNHKINYSNGMTKYLTHKKEGEMQ